MVKLGQMEQVDFEKVRDGIVGGDVGSTHLVKGLDRRLLERVRRGEDVMAKKEEEDEGEKEEERAELGEEEVEDEFEGLEKREVKALAREERVKKGEMAPPPVPGKGRKRTRDDILRELKESRARAKEEKERVQPQLGAKFKRVGAKMGLQGPRIERDEKGREVLITVDEEGNVKRKVRKVRGAGNVADEVDGAEGNAHGLLAVDKDAKPLGMEAPLPSKKVEENPEEEDIDIFDDVGVDYNPLGDMEDEGDSDSDADSDEGEAKEKKSKPEPKASEEARPKEAESDTTPPPTDTSPPPAKSTKRDYFSTGLKRSPSPELSAPTNPLKDSSFLSALKKASNIANRVEGSSSQLSYEEAEAEAAKVKRRKEMLARIDRDAIDMDLRDEDDEGDGKIVSWDDKGAGKEKDDKPKRKRGGKKRKGDKDNVSDVLGVLEGRRKDGAK